MTAPEIRDLVAGHPFTSGLSPAEVDAIADGAHVVDLAPGQHLFREGRAADHAFLKQIGKVMAHRLTGARAQLLDLYAAGS